MRFQGASDHEGWRWDGQVKGFGVGVGDVESVAQVHLKSVAAPAKTILNKQSGELGTVQEICSRDPERVCAPTCHVGVLWREAVDCGGD